jgi:hypothetical protein
MAHLFATLDQDEIARNFPIESGIVEIMGFLIPTAP